MNRASKTHARRQGAAGTPPSGIRDWIFSLVLVLAVILACQPVWHAGFIWDDDTHISANETLRSWGGLWEIWFKPGATAQYYPLSFTGFWVGYHLWGLNPLGYHLLNVVLHGVVAVLLWQVLKRLEVRGAWLAGAIFALHPVNVMSVAWMTELKNTLSGALVLGAAWAYLRFAGLGVYETAAPERAGGRYGLLSLALFLLAMFAKTAVSFLPVTLILLVWWKRGRVFRRCLWPLLAMFGIAAGMGLLTFYVEDIHGTTGDEFRMGLLERVLVSGRSFWFYLGKLFFPYPLTFIYERWKIDTGAWWQYGYPVATLGLLGGLWLLRRRIGKGLFVALQHFYVATSMLILIHVLYMTRYSYVSDHWQYFGCMSVMALAAAGIDTAFDFVKQGRRPLKRAFCGMLLLVLGVLTWQQCGMYADIETLWRTTIARNPTCWMVHNNLALTLLQKGDENEAITHFQKALQINPDYADAHNNLGNVLLQKGNVDEAISHYQRALQINPDYAEAHHNLGRALLEKGNVDEAITHYQIALRINPDNAKVCLNLGNALLKKGSVAEAIVHYQKALQINPDYLEVQNNLAWVLATAPQPSLRNGSQAVELAQRANQLASGGNPIILHTLAAAYAEAGRFSEAQRSAQEAMVLARAAGLSYLVEQLDRESKLYAAGLPLHQESK